jgi:hypothetical protein
MSETFTEEHAGYTITAKSYGIAKFGVSVRSPEGRLIYEAPAGWVYANNAIEHGLRWLKSTWLKEDDRPPGDGGESEE